MAKEKKGVVLKILSSVYIAFWAYFFVWFIIDTINYKPDYIDLSVFAYLLTFIAGAGLIDALIVLISVFSYYSKKRDNSPSQKKAALCAFLSSVFLPIIKPQLRRVLCGIAKKRPFYLVILPLNPVDPAV